MKPTELPYYRNDQNAGPASNSSSEIYVNGEILRPNETRWVDRSSKPVEVIIRLRRSATHVGACCQPTWGQQRVGVTVEMPNPYLFVEANRRMGFFGLDRHYTIPGIHINRTALKRTTFLTESDQRELSNVPDEMRHRTFVYEHHNAYPNPEGRFPITEAPYRWQLELQNETSQLETPYAYTYGHLKFIDWLLETRADELDWKNALVLKLWHSKISSYARKSLEPAINGQIRVLENEIENNPLGFVTILRNKLELAYETQKVEVWDQLEDIVDLTLETLSTQDDAALIELLETMREQQQINAEYIQTILSELKRISNKLATKKEEDEMKLELKILEKAQYE